MLTTLPQFEPFHVKNGMLEHGKLTIFTQPLYISCYLIILYYNIVFHITGVIFHSEVSPKNPFVLGVGYTRGEIEKKK